MSKPIKIQYVDLPKDRRKGFGNSSFSYCRQLIADGISPKSKLEVYRGEDLSFSVIIEDGAKLTVKWPDDGIPCSHAYFAPYIPFKPWFKPIT